MVGRIVGLLLGACWAWGLAFDWAHGKGGHLAGKVSGLAIGLRMDETRDYKLE